MGERVLDRLDAAAQGLDEQEEEDPSGNRVEERAGLGAEVPQPPDRQPDEDGQAGDRPEEQDLTGRHVAASLTLPDSEEG